MWKRAALGSFLAALIATALPAAGNRPPGIGEPAPEISGATWINSAPLTLGALRGKVVLVEFWTYG